MPKRNPLTLPTLRRSLSTLRATLKHADKKPFTGVTQGGSSRRDSGAKVAATTATVRQNKTRRDNDKVQ